MRRLCLLPVGHKVLAIRQHLSVRLVCMTEASFAPSARRPHRRRDALQPAALVAAATAGFRFWWSRRHENAPPPTDTGAAAPSSTDRAPGAGGQETVLWRMRTTVRDEPGSLAVLCTALSARRVDILSLQTHPLSDGTVDEFLLRAPDALTPDELTRTVAGAGGTHSWLERADAHDLVDAPTRMLGLATRTALDSAELPWHYGSCSAAAPSIRCPRGPSTGTRSPSRSPRRACWRSTA